MPEEKIAGLEGLIEDRSKWRPLVENIMTVNRNICTDDVITILDDLPQICGEQVLSEKLTKDVLASDFALERKSRQMSIPVARY